MSVTPTLLLASKEEASLNIPVSVSKPHDMLIRDDYISLPQASAWLTLG